MMKSEHRVITLRVTPEQFEKIREARHIRKTSMNKWCSEELAKAASNVKYEMENRDLESVQ